MLFHKKHFILFFWLSFELWDKLEKEAIEKALLKKGGYMDIKEEIRLEGRWEGRQEGRQEGREEVIRNMLREKVDLAVIAKVTGLPVREIKKLKNGS